MTAPKTGWRPDRRRKPTERQGTTRTTNRITPHFLSGGHGMIQTKETVAMMTRAEHLRWAKDRALAYVDEGDTHNALASMNSDLRKHPETADHAGRELGILEVMIGGLSTPREMREWIEGFN